MQKQDKPRKYSAKRYTISVSGKIYQHLHLVVEDSSIQKFVDGLIRSALDDQPTRDRILARCTPKKSRESSP